MLIFCAINVGGRKLVKEQEVGTVLIDEAAQSHEASSLVVLRSDVEKLILVGDPRRLPAVVSSDFATRAGFQRLLFERLEVIGHTPSPGQLPSRVHKAAPPRELINLPHPPASLPGCARLGQAVPGCARLCQAVPR